MKVEGWRLKNKGWMMKDKGWMMKDRLDDDLFEGFKLLRGFDDRLTDICECKVAFATEKIII